MKEIEIKILELNPEEIRNKLTNLGAEKVFDGRVHAIHFDVPDERLRKAGETLRIRKVDDQVELCFKGKNISGKFKTKEEIEVTTSNFDDTIKIFEKLGFERFYEGKKRRESYKLGNIRFEIDTYPNMPTFLEIEAPTEEEVVEYVQKLGYTMDQTSNLTALELEKYYKTKK